MWQASVANPTTLDSFNLSPLKPETLRIQSPNTARNPKTPTLPYRVTSLMRNSFPSQDRHRAQDIVLLSGPLLLMSEVPLYPVLRQWPGRGRHTSKALARQYSSKANSAPNATLSSRLARYPGGCREARTLSHTRCF